MVAQAFGQGIETMPFERVTVLPLSVSATVALEPLTIAPGTLARSADDQRMTSRTAQICALIILILPARMVSGSGYSARAELNLQTKRSQTWNRLAALAVLPIVIASSTQPRGATPLSGLS